MAAKQQTQLIGTVADNIRRLRREVHMTQTDLADAAGISRASVAQIEGQRYSSFTLATLEGIAAALGVAPDILLKPLKITLTTSVQNFAASPWVALLKPSEDELRLLNEAVLVLNLPASVSLSLLAELFQLLKRIQHSVSVTD